SKSGIDFLVQRHAMPVVRSYWGKNDALPFESGFASINVLNPEANLTGGGCIAILNQIKVFGVPGRIHQFAAIKIKVPGSTINCCGIYSTQLPKIACGSLQHQIHWIGTFQLLKTVPPDTGDCMDHLQIDASLQLGNNSHKVGSLRLTGNIPITVQHRGKQDGNHQQINHQLKEGKSSLATCF